MILYRIKQFFRAVTAKITYEDLQFIDIYLNHNEKEIFNKLSVYDKKHSINVAKDIKIYLKDLSEMEKDKLNIKEKNMIKLGLLHDIGKVYKKLNPIEKSILVLLNSLTKEKIKKYDNIKAVKVYYRHGEMGFNILKKYNYEEDFLCAVKNHHYYSNNNTLELKILQKADNNN